jgi:fructose-1,6-bisphosphatase
LVYPTTGKATRIPVIRPEAIHERTPISLGSTEEADRVLEFLD